MAENKDNDMLQFVTIIKEHGMPLLTKSKKPNDKIAKENAALAIINSNGMNCSKTTQGMSLKCEAYSGFYNNFLFFIHTHAEFTILSKNFLHRIFF